MLYIENGGTRLGILPDVGGRVVLLSRNGAPNIFKSDYRLWDEDERLQPAATNWNSDLITDRKFGSVRSANGGDTRT